MSPSNEKKDGQSLKTGTTIFSFLTGAGDMSAPLWAALNRY
jgi:hypothetical protein